jgi:hypothetical protein
MSGGFCSPTTCGFAKVPAIYSAKKAKGLDCDPAKSPKSQEIEARYKCYCKCFVDNQDGFKIDYKTFNKRILAFQAVVRKFFTEFSCERWFGLSLARKNEHTFANCKGCYQNYAQIHAWFPVKILKLKSKAK